MKKLCELEGLISEFHYLSDLKRSYEGLIQFIKNYDSTFCVDSFSYHSHGDVKDFIFHEDFRPSSDDVVSLLSSQLNNIDIRLKEIHSVFQSLGIDCSYES